MHSLYWLCPNYMQQTLLKLISFGAIILIICLLIFIFLNIFNIKNPIKKMISDYRLELLFLVSLMGTVGSLLLSIYFKLGACELCWYQRVFLFCMPVITGIAIIKKHTFASVYIFWLALIGLCLSTYHALIQSKFFVSDSVFCNPNSAIDCSIPSFTYYGFVTIPVIAFSVFLLLIVISYESKK